MDFGYDLLANPQKIRCQTEIKPPNLNVGNNQNLIVDQIEDTIVESMPYIHSKIDGPTDMLDIEFEDLDITSTHVTLGYRF